MDFASDLSKRRYDELVTSAERAVVGLDFDGTLAPIVEDPQDARIHPEAGGALVELAPLIEAVAVVTGRPVRQAVSLGDLDEIGARDRRERRGVPRPRPLRQREVVGPRPPGHLAASPQGSRHLMSELPDLLRRNGLEGAHIESKGGLAVAVHTRRMEDPDAAQEKLTPILEKAARGHGLVTEPGRMVVEVRASGMDKGSAVRNLQKQMHADAMVFVGDDLGDLEAFDAVADLRRGGMVGFLVCSGSDEQHALVEKADLVVDGPDGVVAFLHQLAADVRRPAD